MEAAKEWGVHPSEVWEGSGVWFNRWRFQRVQMDMKIEKDSKRAK